MELRQTIEKQLNKLESSNKFGKAVFHGNNQEFQLSTKEEQLIADTDHLNLLDRIPIRFPLVPG